MSTSERDDRLLREDPALPAELRAAFAAYSQIAPGRDARAALLERIERAEPGEPLALDAVVTPGEKAGHRKLWLVLSLLGLSLAGTLVWQSTRGEAEQTALGLGEAVDTQQGVPSPSSPVVGAASAPEAPLDVPGERPIVLPAARAAPTDKRAHARRAPEASVAAREDADPVDPSQELALLTRAKRVLPGDALAALNLTREHAARFPRGVFREEREVIAIEALARGGQRERALSRASAFRQAFPRSTHLDRLAVILREF